MGNEVHKIQDKVRVDYVLNSHANTSQGKDHESDKVCFIAFTVVVVVV